MVELYRAGQSLRQIAALLNLSHETARRYLRESGIPLRPAHYRSGCSAALPADIARVARELGVRRAGESLGVSRSAIYKRLRELGVSLLKPIGCRHCQEDPYARGLCKRCYQTWLRRGKPPLG